MEELKKQIWEALSLVIDPELNVSIVGLGLIYAVEVKKTKKDLNQVIVTMTLTSPGCPLAGLIDSSIGQKVRAVSGVGSVKVEVVWDPAWNSGMISDEVKAELGIDE